jgi:hypothetical protein
MAQTVPVGAPGAYAFTNGFPTPEASRRARDDVDFERAVVAYRFWYPTVSAEGIFHGLLTAGVHVNEHMMIQETGPRHVLFTANSDTPYGSAVMDLGNGPWVVEIPPGPLIGLANGRHQDWILDMGLPGPAGDKGARHLLLPPDHPGEAPAGYFAGRALSNRVFIAVRSLPIGGDVKTAMDRLRQVKVHPLADGSARGPLSVIDLSDVSLDGTCLAWETDIQFWNRLHEVIDAEPLAPRFLPMYGELAALGIEKGRPFAPDARMKAILQTAARTARDQMLVSAFASDRPDRFAWKDRRWEWVGLVPESAQFETPGGIDIEARDRWFAQAIVTSPAMFRRTAGAGSLYWLGARDATGAFLDGGRTYRLAVPLPVPAGLFWSVTVYDAATRSEVQAPQDKAALRSLFELKGLGSTGSAELYFGPRAPAGQEGRWIQTVPDRGWFAYFRVYGPQGPAFDGTWKPGDFEALETRH